MMYNLAQSVIKVFLEVYSQTEFIKVKFLKNWVFGVGFLYLGIAIPE